MKASSVLVAACAPHTFLLVYHRQVPLASRGAALGTIMGAIFRDKSSSDFCTGVMRKLLCMGERVLHCKVSRRAVPSKTHGAIAMHLLRFENDFYQAGLSK
jgi:hypothetical protein